MRFSVKLVALVLGIMAVLAAASVAGAYALQRGNGGPTKPSDSDGMVPVLAPIDGVEINVAESYPPQYFLHVTSGLPNGCVKFDHYDVERDGKTIKVKVWNLAPQDPNTICTMIYGVKEHNIALGSDFVSGETYTVIVNDKTETFVAQ